MDSGKLAKLKEVGWKPAKCCGSCEFGKFSPGHEFGLCGAKINTYTHNKHKRIHELPAHRNAVCDRFIPGYGSDDVQVFLDSPVTS